MSEYSDNIREMKSAAPAAAIGNIDANPDEAARAIQLEKSTGTPASSIYGDIEGFEQQHKSTLAGNIVANNPQLQDYVNSHPLAAPLSADDYGNLDEASKQANRLKRIITGTNPISLALTAVPAASREAWHKMIEGWGEPGGSWYKDDDAKNYPIATAAMLTAEIPFRALAAVMGGVAGAAKGGAESLYETYTGDEAGAARFGRDIGGMAEMMLQGGGPMGVHNVTPKAMEAHIMGLPKVTFTPKQMEAFEAAKEWLDNRVEPPRGLHPEIDKLKADRNKMDLEELDDSLKAAVASGTRGRAPDMYAGFMRQHFGEAKIGISGDKIAELYKDKVPEIDDNLLGWVPGIKEQLEAARETGQDIQILIADWLAKVDPAIAKELKDDIRVRPGNITKAESDLTKDLEPTTAVSSPLAQVRGASALEPAFSIGDRKLELKRLEQTPKSAQELAAADGLDWDKLGTEQRSMYRMAENMRSKFGPETGFHDFTLMDEQGRDVGTINLSAQQGGKQLYIEMISGINGLGPRDFGPSLMRDLLRQLKAEFPEAETITGHRVSGARDKAGSFDRPSAQPVVKLSELDLSDVRALHDHLTDVYWEQFSDKLSGAYKPTDLYTKHETELVKAVNDELARIVPKGVEAQELAAIELKDARGTPAGAYVQYPGTGPLILWSLGSKDPVGVARHEAVHHLRQNGFFKDAEWSTLTKASEDLGWIEKYKIEKRYGEANIEEAVADAFRDWAKNKDSLVTKGKETLGLSSPIERIFRKLQDFLDAIGKRFKEILGHEPTWEELFESAFKGEIGKREGGEPLHPEAFRLSQQVSKSDIGSEQHLKEVANRQAPVPTTAELRKALDDARKQSEAELGPEVDKQLRRLNSRIDAGGPDADIAIKEKAEITKKFPEESAVKIDEDSIRQLLREYESLERSAETPEAHIDGIARVLKRYIANAASGDDFAKAVIRKGMEEVQKSGGNTQALGRDVLNRFLDDLSEGDRAFMKQEFEALNRPQIEARFSLEDRADMLRANATGLDLVSFKRLQKLIEARHEQDYAAALKRAEREQRRQQSQEWKDKSAAIRPQVVDDIKSRPDVAADLFLTNGEMFGQKLGEGFRIRSEDLTPEQAATLPRNYLRKDGLPADEVANMFGFRSREELIQSLGQFNEQRKLSGKNPDLYRRQLIDEEVQRRMEKDEGFLEKNILEEARDQALSETQLQLLSEESTAAGIMAKVQTVDLDTVKALAKDRFDNLRVGDISTDHFMMLMGKNGREAERALVARKPAEAVGFMQRKTFNTVMAKMAKDLETSIDQLNRQSKKYLRQDVKGVDLPFVDHIQQLLAQAGYKVRKSPEDIQRGLEFHGQEALPDLVRSTQDLGWEPVVSDSLQAKGAKALDSMTSTEFYEFKDAITSLDWIGRQINKIEIAGEKAEFADFRKTVLEHITQLPARPRESQGRWLYNIDASLTRMEEMVKDLDLREELGPLWRAVIEPTMLSKSKEYDLQTALSDHFATTKGAFDKKWRKSLADSVPQDIIWDPYSQTPFDMTKENLLQVMLNWGNRSNIQKYVAGAGWARWGVRLNKEQMAVYEGQIKALIDKHATKEDWDFVQRMWEPFKGWQKQMDVVARNTSGVAPKWIEPEAIATPHGQFDGGYWPVKYDRLGSNIKAIEESPGKESEGVFGKNYFRAATSKGYLKERTGYVDFVDISTSIEQAVGTMQQTIHDIAFRDSLIQGSKVFYDPQIRAAIRKHYGAEYEAQLVPWLKRIAYQFSTDDSSIRGWNDFLRRARVNLVGHTLPLNLKVILSPDIGVPNPMAWARFEANRSLNMALAMEKSQELRHLVYSLDRDYNDALRNVTIKAGTGELGNVQKKAIEWGYKPIAKISQEFRASTFIDAYNKALKRGLSDHDASLVADSTVRERHGAASVADLPAALQSNEGMKMLTIFQGYFNTMYNWQRQIPGNIRRGEYANAMETGLGSVIVGAAFGAALFNQQKKDDSWFKTIAKALVIQPLSTIPVLNSVSSFVFEGFSPRMPYASMLTSLGQVKSDVVKAYKGERPEKPITHGSNVVGLATGLPLAQLGRTTQFGYDVGKGYQRPRNIGEWARGIITGEARLK